MFRYSTFALALVVSALCAGAEDLLVLQDLSGRQGGRLVYAQRSEPKTFNPIFAADSVSREAIGMMMADLVHINRYTQRTEPALAKSWTVSPDGRRYALELRRGIRFSDGQPFSADDVVFSFRVYLDTALDSPQRDLLMPGGKPIVVKKVGDCRVEFDLPVRYAAAERLFDGFAILPRHLLEPAYKTGKLAEAWGLRTPPAAITGLGPFRLKQNIPGQRLVLERNPYYWKADKNGIRLPYLNEVDLTQAGSEDMQVLRFESGESDVIRRVGAHDFAVLEKESRRRGYTVSDLGPGMEYTSLYFNLDPAAGRPGFLRRRSFRQAVSTAIDRNALVRLVYGGHAAPLGTPVPPGNKAWVDASLRPPVPSVSAARALLSSGGFKWSGGNLLDPAGQRVEFSIITSAGNDDRVQMATLIQADLKELGIQVDVVPLEFRSLLDRVLRTHQFDTALMSMADGDADPNPDMNTWMSDGGNHLWNTAEKSPSMPWEAEIDRLMRQQMTVPDYARRKKMYDLVQQILMEHMPLVPLVSPDILVGAKRNLGNFRPALMDHYTLWNIEELYWRELRTGERP